MQFRSRVLSSYLLPLACCLLPACGFDEGSSNGSMHCVEKGSEFTLISNTEFQSTSFVPLKEAPDSFWIPWRNPIQIDHDEQSVTVTRLDSGPVIPYMVFEGGELGSAYGIYATFGAKNGLPVPRPFAGESVTWPGLDHRAALTRLLERAGLPAGAARDLVRARRSEWFSPGLRVLWVLDRKAAEGLPMPWSVTPSKPILVHRELRD